MTRRLPIVALTSAALVLTACANGGGTSDTPAATSSTSNAGKTITLWLAGGDTPDELRTYLSDTFKAKTGATLKIEEQAWPDLVTKLTTALPDAENTPDVVELGNTQSPTFTNVGAFLDISDQYDALGGDKLLQSFVEAGSVDGKKYALPYYFGSRYMFMRKDVWKEAGVNTPTTLDEFNAAVTKVAQANPRHIKNFSGFFIGGQDWRNGISWIFANGGDLAKKENGQWVSTLSDPNSLKGLQQLQTIQKTASNAPADAKDQTPWLYVNDADVITDADGKATGKTTLSAATIMAPGWAHWSIGDAAKKDGKVVREWNDEEVRHLRAPGQRRQAGPGLRRWLEHRHLGQDQEPRAVQGADEDHLLRRLPEEARRGGPRPGQLRLRLLAGHRRVRQGAHRLGLQLQADPGRTRAGPPSRPRWSSRSSSARSRAPTTSPRLAKLYDAKITPMLNGQ